MHDEIIRFSMSGQMLGSNKVKERERMVSFLEGQMKDNGCAPVLDLTPQFTVDYQEDTETYKFELTVYGIFVGTEEAWQTAGVTNGTTTTTYTRKRKSKESSDTVE